MYADLATGFVSRDIIYRSTILSLGIRFGRATKAIPQRNEDGYHVSNLCHLRLVQHAS